MSEDESESARKDDETKDSGPDDDATGGRQLEARSAILGTVVGLVAGLAIGAAIAWPIQAETAPPRPASLPSGMPGPRAARPPASGAPAAEQAVPSADHVYASFAQQGEDLVMMQILLSRGVKRPTYVDVGAHDPTIGNNTYWFYRLGGHGVLVEPNPAYVAKLRQVRQRDVVLDVGVGVTEQAEADYYVIEGDGQLNTFSKTQVESLQKVHHMKVVETMKRRLVKLDSIFEQHFKDKAPDVLSIDVEGLDLQILKTVDWQKWRPHVVCVETSDVETGKVEHEIIELMEKNGYEVRGGSYVNTVFMDTRWTKTVTDAGSP